MREPDIKLVKLKRMTMEKKKQEFRKQDDEFLVSGINSWLVADYFDIMQVESIKLETPFSKWLDMATDGDDANDFEQGDAIAAQSYTLYCGSAMQEEYEEHSGKAYRKDPFKQDQDAGMDILSIIHVYIMPEILARMNVRADEIGDEKGILLRQFIDDLYSILDLFSEKNKSESFWARVYMMLSAGDLAIVVRSKEPDLACRIATYIRKRRANRNVKNPSPDQAYVLYKTYTLSTIRRKTGKSGENKDMQGQVKTKDRFIVRGYYSNLYWRNKMYESPLLSNNENDDAGDFHPLGGRYDFTVRLSEDEFCQVMSATDNEEAEKAGKEQSIRVQQLRYLIAKEGLSGINERYLIDKIKEEPKLTDEEITSKSVFISENSDKDERSLKDVNKDQIKKLYEIWNQIIKGSRTALGYRKNIQKYLYMLRREINLCESVNESSDTRIYAKILIELLGNVLAAVKRYFNKYNNHMPKCDTEINALEDNLRKAITVLDSYAQYIRNNNLQSIQTPNYNVETAMGAEKILIGYSELLWCFIEFYKRAVPDTSQKEYLTVMVPDLRDRDVNIDVMFSNEELPDMSDEGAGKRQADSMNKRLIVIGSPTLEELTDFPVIFPALFHEVAHQFRYEKRIDRNKAVLRSTVWEIMHGFSKYLTKVVNEQIEDEANEGGWLCAVLTEELTNFFMKRKDSREEKAKIENQSLAQFSYELYGDINDLFALWKQRARLEARVREFIFDLRYELDYLDEKTIKLIQELATIFDNKKELSEEGDNDQKTDNGAEGYDTAKRINLAVTHAFNLAGKCAYLYQKDTGSVWVPVEVREEDRCWEVEWEQIFGKEDENTPVEQRQIKEAFMSFLSWTQGYEEELRQDGIESVKFSKWETLDKELYDKMLEHWGAVAQKCAVAYCWETNEWQEEKEQRGTAGSAYRYWTHVGRKLGLDYGGQAGRFDEIVQNVLVACEFQISPSFLEVYREETADLLMCSVMKLTPMGYLNLVASLFVSEDKLFHATDLERVFCVLYIFWCYKGNGEEAWITYRQLLRQIFADIKENEKTLLSGCTNGWPKVKFPDGEIPIEDNVEDNIKAEDTIKENMGYMESCRSEIIEGRMESQDNNSLLGELDNILRCCSLLIDLIWQGKCYWIKLHNEKEVILDLQRGCEQLRQLKNSEHLHGREDYYKKGIEKIYRVGGYASEYLTKSYSQKGMGNNSESNKEINRECMELLLMMYYHNKIRTAQERRSEQTDGD